MNSSHTPLQKAYQKEDNQLRIFHLQVGLIISIVVLPIFGLLDWAVYPKELFTLLTIRALTEAVSILLLIATFTDLKKYIKTLSLSGATLQIFAICAMVLITEGANSPYYAGLCLIVLGTNVLLHWNTAENTLFSALTISAYLLTCLIHSTTYPGNIELHTLLNNLFFLTATSSVCIVSGYFKSKSLFEKFRLNFELNMHNQELAEIDEMKSQFFANISHELRTPLTLILSPIQSLLDNTQVKALPKNTITTLKTIQENSYRLLRLVNNLLDILKLNEGKATLKTEKVPLIPYLKKIIKSMTYLAKTQGIELTSKLDHLSTQNIQVIANKDALEKVILNILNNAIKFTPDSGKIRIKLTLTTQCVSIHIQDSGIGIDKSSLPSIFERFQQADGSSTRPHQGTGLGLALVKELTEQQNGQVRIYSKKDKGTSVILTFPIVTTNLSQEAPLATNIEPNTDTLTNLYKTADKVGGLSLPDCHIINTNETPNETTSPNAILVIDDEPAICEYLVHILKAEHQVLSAENGETGLQLAQKHRPTVIILDMMMPKMSGLEVLKALKADKKTQQIKVIMLTARVDETTKLDALSHGANDFLTKPFSSQEVILRVKNCYHTAKLEAELKTHNKELEQTLSTLKQTQAQLIHSEKINSLGTLTAGLLHEINNPINYSLMALNLIQQTEEIKNNEELNESIQDIQYGINRVHEIISDLKAFSHPSSAEKKSACKIEDIIEHAVRFSSHACKQIVIKKDIPKDIEVIGSQSHIIQVLVNLLINGAHAITEKSNTASEPGTIAIVAKAIQNKLHISVKDNGIGMNKETANRIFDPFFTTRTVGEGTGLGLSICHTIIKSHGSTITVNSEQGTGTEFLFELPITTKS